MGFQTTKRVLIVDGDPRGQEKMELLNAEDCPWRFELLHDGREALSQMLDRHYDAVISDRVISGMDGAQLLERIGACFPGTVLLLKGAEAPKLGGKENRGKVPYAVRSELDLGVLVAGLERAFRMEQRYKNESLRSVLAGIKDFPSLPSVYTCIVAEVEDPNGSLETVGWHISQDPVLTARILQVVNSSFFGLASRISDPVEAVIHLGAEKCASFVLLAKVMSEFEKNFAGRSFMNEIWQHSIYVGSFARFVASKESRDPEVVRTAYTAGLLHDLGKILFAANFPDKYSKVLALQKEKNLYLWEAEQEVAGTTHSELGAFLLDEWELSRTIVEAVANHHHPGNSDDRSFSVLTAVYAANILSHKVEDGAKAPGKEREVDMEYLNRIHVAHRYPQWSQLSNYAPRM